MRRFVGSGRRLAHLFLICWVAFWALVIWGDYAKYGPIASQAEQHVLQVYSTFPTPEFAKRTAFTAWHKPHAAGVSATYSSRVTRASVAKYYTHEFAKRNWRVSDFVHGEPAERYYIFENGDLQGELDFPPNTAEQYIIKIGWVDDEPLYKWPWHNSKK